MRHLGKKFAGPCAQGVLNLVIIHCLCAQGVLVLGSFYFVDDLVYPWGPWIRKCAPWQLLGGSLLAPCWIPVVGRDAFDRFWVVLAASLVQLQPNFGPTWTNLNQLGSNFGQLGCKIGQLRSTMALNCTILDQNGPLET